MEWRNKLVVSAVYVRELTQKAVKYWNILRQILMDRHFVPPESVFIKNTSVMVDSD